jgi:hypothetical protein
MSLPAKSPVNFRILQNSQEIAILRNVKLVIRSNMVGTVGDVPCFPELRFVNFWDQRRAMDVTTKRYNGPVSVEIITAATGERIQVIAIADRQDVAAHPCGKVAHVR